MKPKMQSSGTLAAAITKSASKQTYYTIRLFADRSRIQDAYRAYGYFRWLDDVLDEETVAGSARSRFIERQKALVQACYRAECPADVAPEERMLVDLIQHDTEKNSGLQMYIRSMMEVMVFDAGRRGRLISQSELDEYSRNLSVAVTEAIYYFIGHQMPCPRHEARYLAVTAAHITHMLRDAIEDVENGYFNIPREEIDRRQIEVRAVNNPAYRQWVGERVRLARGYFARAREYTRSVKNLRCRLAGFTYTARFEWVLGAIERDNYTLRRAYPQRKSLRAGLWMLVSAMRALLSFSSPRAGSALLTSNPVQVEE